MSELTILCVTNGGGHAAEFLAAHARTAREVDASLRVAVDGEVGPAVSAVLRRESIGIWQTVRSNGCIENVLDEAINACPDGHILRLDDDETVTHQMRDWLSDGEYRAAEHWAFPRLHLYPDAAHYITTAPLYPDLQTRLSLKQFAGGRRRVHEGSPYGTGTVAPVAIAHHKFLCRPVEERRALLERYESLQSGAGRDFGVFSVPEDHEAGLAWERV